MKQLTTTVIRSFNFMFNFMLFTVIFRLICHLILPSEIS